MNDQVTVRLGPRLAKCLRRASRDLQVRPSEVVRTALRQFLQPRGVQRRKRPMDRVSHLIGKLSSGIPDLAERHREYILESLSRGR